MFKDRCPEKGKRLVEFIALLSWFGLALALAVISTNLVVDMIGQNQLSPAMRMPIWIAYASVPAGTILMTVRLIQQFYFFWRARNENQTVEENNI